MAQAPDLNSSLCLLVEDHPKTAEHLQDSLRAVFPHMQVVGCKNFREAQQWLDNDSAKTSSVPFRLALVDLGLPDGTGADLIRKINLAYPEVINLVVTIYDENSYLFDALSAGAMGYILKDEGLESIAESLRKVAKGEPAISPSIARRILSHFKNQQPQPVDDSGLSTRQKETLTLLVRGLTIPEVAEHLGLSAQTVASYVKVIYHKLQVSNRAEATREAIRRGLA